MKTKLITAAIALTVVGFSGAALAHGDPYGLPHVMNGHYVTAQVASAYHNKVAVSNGLIKVAAHTYSNVRAEKPVNCMSTQARVNHPMKWAGFCANGGGGH